MRSSQQTATVSPFVLLIAACLLACIGEFAVASPSIEVTGLFRNQAVLKVSGADRILKVGQTSPEGVKLISADAHKAVVSYEGKRQTLTLSTRVAGSFTAAEKQRVSIPPDELGQYRVRGTINGQYVNLLVDTGASVVALSSDEAVRLGIDYRRGKKGEIQTAQGTAESHMVILDEVSVAGITAHNVQAAVITGMYPVDILLGMTFLRQVSIEENAGLMTLIQKY
ncbi:MAG: TIGR02281 family clan AA aspartic protease [Pseudomonadales bacterium]|nr:TIGR02281 family clan AA aspartic protease [Pseudomonadales bacterium]